jgi:hypothetical protein
VEREYLQKELLCYIMIFGHLTYVPILGVNYPYKTKMLFVLELILPLISSRILFTFLEDLLI